MLSRDMMKHYLLCQVDTTWRRWQADFETLCTPEQIAQYQKRRHDFFVQAIGGLPERTPLNAQITGVLTRPGYRVEKLLFESQPRHYVTGSLYIPDGNAFAPPYPAVLVPCGHIPAGKAHDEYQSMGALLAINGMVALVYDPPDQGERGQLLDDAGNILFPSIMGHTMAGIGCILLGRNLARYEIWDGMRAIDYLQSRHEIDPDKIGCTGNSGGGTQTSYLMALDPRIKAAAVSCYLHTLAEQLRSAPGDAEQNIFGQLEFGMEHPDYILMQAPRPVLMCATTKDFFNINATWEMFRYVKRLYTRMGNGERVDILENDAEHNYNKTQREGIARFMSRWLIGKELPIVEPDLALFSEQDLRATPEGQVMRMAGVRSVYNLNEEYANELETRRRARAMSDDELRERIRLIAGIRPLEDLPKPIIEPDADAVIHLPSFPRRRESSYTINIVEDSQETLYLRAFEIAPSSVFHTVLCVHQDGIEAAVQEDVFKKRVGEGCRVFCVEPRGTGLTQQTGQGVFGPAIGLDWEDYFKAYCLGKSYVGMRAEDILVCAIHLTANSGDAVELISWGNVGIPALHAAALEPQLFTRIHLVRNLISWADAIHQKSTFNQLINAVHGALTVYDLPDLVSMLEGKTTIDDPLDALGRELREVHK